MIEWLLLIALCSPPQTNQIAGSKAHQFKWHVSGWADIGGYWDERDSERFSLDVHHVYMLNHLKFSPKLELLVEMALEREYERSSPRPDRELELERAYLQYKWRPQATFRVGQFYTPCGLYKQRHWAYTMDTFQKPVIEENQYIPANALGIEVTGNFSFERSYLQYALLISDGDQSGDMKPLQDEFGFGGDVKYNYNDRFLAGMSLYRYRNEAETDNYLNATQIYAEWDLFRHQLQWRMEWLFLERSGFPETDGYYSQLKWNFTKVSYLNLRWEKAEDQLLSQGSEHAATLLTLGIHLPKRWKVKLEYAVNQFEHSEYSNFNQLGLWAGYAF